MNLRPLLVLVGPTAVGKTEIAIQLCEQMNGEIVSADSMQIYRGCDIATAKPSRDEQARAPHHLIDICDPRDSYSAAQWASDAREVVANLQARGKQPIVAGGTGFYVNALLKPGLAAPAPQNFELRAQLEAERDQFGALFLHEKLRALDEDAANRLHANDFGRVSRAIEVALWRRDNPATQSDLQPPDFRAFRLTREREVLYERIERRVDAMLRAGMLDELRGLLSSGVPRDAPALRGVGYFEMLPVVDDASRESESVEGWKRETRRYAKRQETWFRHQLQSETIDLDALSTPGAARVIVEAFSRTKDNS